MENGDVLDRLAVTLSGGNYDALTARLVALQLAGGARIQNKIGPDDPGEIHLAVIADPRLNTSAFATRLNESSSCKCSAEW